MKNIGKNTVKWLAFSALLLFFAVSCQSSARTDNAAPRRPTSQIRLDNIKTQIPQNPVYAINLIEIFRETYSIAFGADNENWVTLAQLKKEAVENLQSSIAWAAEQRQWEEAASLNRSLVSLGLESEFGGEADFALAGAKRELEVGNNLGAFLSAVTAHNLRPLDFETSLLFLERAVELRQRRTAAFFLAAAENAAGGSIPADLRAFATGRDTVTEMLNGVATVLVDRGMRIQAGRVIPDRSIGSAFFVDNSGLMITNYHVIFSEVDRGRAPSRLTIRMGDATSPRIPARVIGWDKALDLALIRAEITPEFVFSPVDWVIPQVGDTVLAIGSPGGLENTVTAGIVSALGRRFLQIGDVYQIDAAVNPGNSGGPVIDNMGRLVGVVYAGIVNHEGLNFAIPAERLAAALPALMNGGRAPRPWLGLSLHEARSFAEIIYVSPNTPAMQHRIAEGSIIKTINDRAVNVPHGALIPALQDIVFRTRPGELVALETQAPNGEIRRRVIMTAERPELPLVEAARIDSRERIAAPLFGLVLAPFQGGGFFSPNFVVSRVIRGSIADEAGISEHDPISIRRLRIMEDRGIAVLDVSVQKRRMGFLETSMQLPAWLDSPDTL